MAPQRGIASGPSSAILSSARRSSSAPPLAASYARRPPRPGPRRRTVPTESQWSDPLAEDRYSEELFYTLTGVRKYQFKYFFATYCGRDTPIDKHQKLFMLLRWYKQYPRARELGVTLGVLRHGTRITADVQRWSAWLAGAINNAELLITWHARFEQRNQLPVPEALFDGLVTGHLDTFPIYLCKPQDGAWQRFTYNRKYGANVLKVQMIVDNTGTPMWLSGPHLGTIHDFRLARQHMPASMQANERFLADKAYHGRGMPHLCVPYKKPSSRPRQQGAPQPPRPPRLTRQQQAFNIVSHTITHSCWHTTALLAFMCC